MRKTFRFCQVVVAPAAGRADITDKDFGGFVVEAMRTSASRTKSHALEGDAARDRHSGAVRAEAVAAPDGRVRDGGRSAGAAPQMANIS